MDHLDALEAQSIYIFREAFARLKKLALLWSLGKDSNVMIWLARKAFFGRVPFPAMHVDTGKKFPEMYAFRDRYGKEWELDLKSNPARRWRPSIRPCRRPRDPPRARPRAEARARQIWLRWIDRRHSPRRGGHPRQGTVFSPRGTEGGWDVRDQPPEFWDQFNASPPPGAHLRIHPILHWTEADIWAYTKRENIPIIRSICQRRQALSLAGRRRHHRSGGVDRIEHRGNPDRTRRHQSAGTLSAERSITKPKMLSSGCASRAISETTASRGLR